MNTFRAILIDFDDTLCQNEADGFAMENEALRLVGQKPQTREMHQQTWGKPLFDIIGTRSPGVDVEAFREAIVSLWPEWVKAGKMDSIFPANLRALDTLLARGKEIYVVTSRSGSEVTHLLAKDHDLSGRIHAFYYRDVMEYHKPDPRAFDIVLRTHELLREDCVYVGDTLGDAQAAKGAGFAFIATIESGLMIEPDFAEAGADAIISRFSDLPKAIAQLEAKRSVPRYHLATSAA